MLVSAVAFWRAKPKKGNPRLRETKACKKRFFNQKLLARPAGAPTLLLEMRYFFIECMRATISVKAFNKQILVVAPLTSQESENSQAKRYCHTTLSP